MLDKFLVRRQFSSYEEFAETYAVNTPDRFNFAYDVVDVFAKEQPEKIAMVWCNDDGEERIFTFAQMKEYSDRAANVFTSLGIGKGDPVMLVLKRRYEFWFCILALHKIGAATIPATHLLTAKDIMYRNNAADIKMIVSVAEEEVIKHIEDALPKSPTLKHLALIGTSRKGWINFTEAMDNAPAFFPKPSEEMLPKNEDMMLLYFTSGTTGMPKMVRHDFTYPLGHILTAKYWQNVQDNGRHLTVADTGWAKAVWGKIYGQWFAGSAIMTFDYDRFVPKRMMDVIVKHKVTTFCAPPTIYRFLIKEDLSK